MRPRSHTRTHARGRTRAAAAAFLAVLTAAATFAATNGSAASSSGSGPAASTADLVVTAMVPNSTELNVAGCPPSDPGRTGFGTITPGSGFVTSTDCNVVFGATNSTATLRTYQPDGRGMAMSANAATVTGSGSGNRMLDVDMATSGPSGVGWAGGEGTVNNRLFKTTDGGTTWVAVADSDINANVEGVDAVSTTVAWATRSNSNELYRTVDGSDWTRITMTAYPAASLNRVVAWSANVAWASGAEVVAGQNQQRVWYTSDGGANWTLVWSPANPSTENTDGVALSATRALISSTYGGVIDASNVGGSAQLPTTISFYDVDSPDGTRIAAAGDSGQVFVSSNGGTSYVVRQTPIYESWRTVEYDSSGTITLGGNFGHVLQSVDDGINWTVLDQDVDNARIYGLASLNPSQIVVAMHSSTIATSTDAGATWTTNSQATNTNWRAIDGIDGGRLWRVGGRGAIQTSTDGGNSWTAQTSGTTKLLRDVVALSRTAAVIVGVDGTVLRTTDSGTTWNLQPAPTGASLRVVEATSDGTTLWAGGDGGTLLRSIDGGVTWYAQSSGVTNPIYSLAVWDAQRMFFGTAGPPVSVRSTTDGGVTFATRPTVSTRSVVAAVAVPGTLRGYFVQGGNIITTTDGGVTFGAPVDVDGTGNLADISVTADGQTLWMVGDYGRTVRSTDGGATSLAYTGGNTSRQGTGVVALGQDSAVFTFEGNYQKITDQPTPLSDYDGATASWTGTGFFGLCLRAAPATGSTWPTTGSCPMSNGTNWRALPAHGGLAASSVASTLALGSTTASFRFGMKAPLTQAPGTYQAPVAFEVTAP